MSQITNAQINAYLDSKNISHSQSGYKFLMLAIRYLVDQEGDRTLIRNAYEIIAEQEGTKASYVERSIRLSLIHAYRNSNNRPTNKSFILQAVDHLLYENTPNRDIS